MQNYLQILMDYNKDSSLLKLLVLCIVVITSVCQVLL